MLLNFLDCLVKLINDNDKRHLFMFTVSNEWSFMLLRAQSVALNLCVGGNEIFCRSNKSVYTIVYCYVMLLQLKVVMQLCL